MEKDDVIVITSDDTCYEINVTLNDLVTPFMKKMTKGMDYLLVVGSMGLWNGKKEIVPTLIEGTEFSSVTDMLSNDINDIVVNIYHNKYELECSHHDGTNYYTVIPFKWDMLTHPAMTRVIKDLDLYVDLGHFVKDKISVILRAYNSQKEHKIQFLEELHIDNLPKITADDFVNKYEIEF